MSDVLTSLHEGMSLSSELRIDAACQRFEATWKAGKRPRPEIFLMGWEGPERLVLLRELILIDVVYRRRAGENPSPKDYLHRFSELIPNGLRTRDLTEETAGPLLGFPSKGKPISFSPTTSGRAPAWPKRVGGYRLVQELEHGGTGYLFEAEEEKFATRLAVRVLTPDLTNKPESAERFLRKARAAAAVEHENLVPILDVGTEAGTSEWVLPLFYVVVPLLNGESLDKRLKREGKLSVSEVVRVGRDVAAGLAAVHRKGLVHGDLRPGNVWLDAGTGQARILDFGLARLTDGGDTLSDSRAAASNPAYEAPERLDGQRATPQSDLFSLGAILYECATGKKAFPGATVMAILASVSDHHPAPPAEVNPEIPPHLSSLILWTLAKKRVDRPASADEVIATIVLDPRTGVGATSTSAPSQDSAPRSIQPRDWHPHLPTPCLSSRIRSRESAPRTIQPRNWHPWLLGVAIVVSVAVAVSVWLATRSPTSTGVENPQPKLPKGK